MKENLRYKPLHHKDDNKLASKNNDELCWVLMRSLQAKVSIVIHQDNERPKTVRKYGYENAEYLFCEFFMPMKEQISSVRGKQIIRQEPAVAGMFFVRDTLSEIRSLSAQGLGFELKYLKGRKYLEPVILNDAEMRNFIDALGSNSEVRFFTPDDDKLRGKVGKRIRISKDEQTFEGHIISIRGSVKRWLRMSLENCLVAEIEIDLNALQQKGQVVELIDGE